MANEIGQRGCALSEELNKLESLFQDGLVVDFHASKEILYFITYPVVQSVSLTVNVQEVNSCL